MDFSSLLKKAQYKIPKELIVNLFLWILYFASIAYQNGTKNSASGDMPYLQLSDFIISFNYFLAILVINYGLLPHFFYKKRYLLFTILSCIVLAISIIVEEFWLEKVLFPNTPRGDTFLGYFATLLQIGPTILLFVGFKFAWDNLKKQSDLEQMEKEKVESQLQFLKSQLNPHFLFNNLNNLYSYAQEQSPKTPEIILQLSAIMRYLLYESQGKLVPLQKELNYLADFIHLQELQMEGRGTVEYTTTGEIQSKTIAPLILITFVENCFKHSLSSLADNIVIKIKAEVIRNQLKFLCSNTFKVSDNPSDKLLSKGVGLENIKKRLELQYPGKHQLNIHTKDNIFTVDLILDIEAS
ncbi:MAG: histidine kinase [Saprospiraceae bacterium]